MKTKKFNLQEALLGARVVTRLGENVSSLAYFPALISEYRVCGVLSGHLRVWSIKGEYDIDEPHDFDLLILISP